MEFSWSVFSRIRTEYGEIIRIQSEYRKIRTRKTANTNTFYAVIVFEKGVIIYSFHVKSAAEILLRFFKEFYTRVYLSFIGKEIFILISFSLYMEKTSPSFNCFILVFIHERELVTYNMFFSNYCAYEH